MIIAISGKKNSGKDTVGKVIQYLTTNFSKELKFKEFTGEDISHEAMMNYIMHTQKTSKWKIKKFATIPKQMLCLMLGCTMDDLENRKFKEKELGEEWWYYTDTLFNNSDSEGNLYAYNKYHDKLKDDLNYYIIKLTPRKLLQLLGTECGREIIHPNIWVNALLNQYTSKLTCIYPSYCTCSATYDHDDVEENKEWWEYANMINDCTEYPSWIITDLRFPNELKAVKERKGITIRVNRYTNNSLIDNNIHSITDYQHESETALDNAEFDYTIDNDSSVEDLIEKVRLILKQENLL